MNRTDLDNRALFGRAAAFGGENASLFAPTKAAAAAGKPSKGQQLFTDLDTVIGRIDESHANQATGRGREQTVKKSTVREALKKQMSGINSAVRFIALERGAPEIASRFGSVQTTNDEKLLAQATRFVEAIRELDLEADLIALEQGADLLKRLKERIEALRQLTQSQDGVRHQRSAATFSLKALRARGRMLIKGLDTIVRRKLDGTDAALLDAWKNTIRLPRYAKPVKEEKPAEGPSEGHVSETVAATKSTGSKAAAKAAGNGTAAAESAPKPVVEPVTESAAAGGDNRATR